MASGGAGDILKIGLVAVGGYLLYNWWTTSQAVAAANPASTPAVAVPLPAVPVTTPTATSPVAAPVSTAPAIIPPVTGSGSQSLSAALQAAAGTGNTTLNADQWSYYLTALNGGTALTPTQFSNAFPSLTATNRGSYTAAQFVAGLAAAGLTAPAGYGLNGLGQIRPRRIVPVPHVILRRRSW
jgi:hypothetical protein